MAQTEILEHLYYKRLDGCEEYFTVREINNSLKSINERALRRQILKLLVYGFIEAKTSRKWGMFSDGVPWRRGFRLSKSAMNQVKRMIENTPSESLIIEKVRT